MLEPPLQHIRERDQDSPDNEILPLESREAAGILHKLTDVGDFLSGIEFGVSSFHTVSPVKAGTPVAWAGTPCVVLCAIASSCRWNGLPECFGPRLQNHFGLLGFTVAKERGCPLLIDHRPRVIRVAGTQ